MVPDECFLSVCGWYVSKQFLPRHSGSEWKSTPERQKIFVAWMEIKRADMIAKVKQSQASALQTQRGFASCNKSGRKENSQETNGKRHCSFCRSQYKWFTGMKAFRLTGRYLPAYPEKVGQNVMVQLPYAARCFGTIKISALADISEHPFFKLSDFSESVGLLCLIFCKNLIVIESCSDSVYHRKELIPHPYGTYENIFEKSDASYSHRLYDVL
jgi:hypothetical protein